MNLGNWIRRARIARTTVGSEGAALVGTSTKTHLGNATTVEQALAYLDANQTGAGGLNDPLSMLRGGGCSGGDVAAGTGISVSVEGDVSTVSNTGVLSCVAGSGISIATVNGVATITATGGGGGITSVVGGTGIAVATVAGVATVTENNPLNIAVDGATVTFDLSQSKHQAVTLGGNRTLALSNVDPTRPAFTLTLIQDGTGSRTVTWFSGVSWVGGGTPPTLTTTAGKMDHFGFLRTGSGAYQGFVLGQNG